MATKEARCKNCEQPLLPEDKFCSQCGQAAKTKRLKIRQVRKDVLRKFLHTDSGILRLTTGLATQPGTVAQEYFAGKRKKYYDPLKFLTLTVGISVLLTVSFDLMSGSEGHTNPISALVAKHINIIFFLSVPIAAGFSWLLFLKKGFNYAEHLALHAFLGGFRTVFYLLVFTPLIVCFREYYSAVLLFYFFLWTSYVAWANIQLMGAPIWLTVVKTVLIIILTQTVISIGIFVFSLLYFSK
ncbi:MAG: DUF3667 domain-containing protein [Saprospiraceae bacterium]